jgi:hypothetical protein
MSYASNPLYCKAKTLFIEQFRVNKQGHMQVTEYLLAWESQSVWL